MRVPAYIYKSLKAMIMYDRDRIVVSKNACSSGECESYPDGWALEDYIDKY